MHRILNFDLNVKAKSLGWTRISQTKDFAISNLFCLHSIPQSFGYSWGNFKKFAPDLGVVYHDLTTQVNKTELILFLKGVEEKSRIKTYGRKFQLYGAFSIDSSVLIVYFPLNPRMGSTLLSVLLLLLYFSK